MKTYMQFGQFLFLLFAFLAVTAILMAAGIEAADLYAAAGTLIP
jgi:hypothetical protein